MWASVPPSKTAINTVHQLQVQTGERIFFYRPDDAAYSSAKKAKIASRVAVEAFETALTKLGVKLHEQYIREWHGREITPEIGSVVGDIPWERQASCVSADFTCLVYHPKQAEEALRKKQAEENEAKKTKTAEAHAVRRKGPTAEVVH